MLPLPISEGLHKPVDELTASVDATQAQPGYGAVAVLKSRPATQAQPQLSIAATAARLHVDGGLDPFHTHAQAAACLAPHLGSTRSTERLHPQPPFVTAYDRRGGGGARQAPGPLTSSHIPLHKLHTPKKSAYACQLTTQGGLYTVLQQPKYNHARHATDAMNTFSSVRQATKRGRRRCRGAAG